MSKAYSAVPPHAVKVATAEQMRDFDRRAEQEFGVPSIVLMENAGRHVFEAVRDLIGTVDGRKVAVVAGRGNNGGDGFVAARHLRDAGVEVAVFLLGDPADVKGDAKINLDILLKTGFTVNTIRDTTDLADILPRCDAVIDALFGIGLRGDVQGLAAEIIELINSAGRPVLAVDVPSGLNADTGQVLGICVKADCTVTFALPKIGLVFYPGAMHAGRLRVVDIGIPHHLYDEINVELTSDTWVEKRLPKRFPDSHKGSFGTTLVIAGSVGLTGAAALASEAALRVGAGLSTLAVPVSLQNVMAAKLTEVMTRGLPETDGSSVSAEALEVSLDLSAKADAVVLGCGLGTHLDTCEFVRRFTRSVRKPTVLDADALNCLVEAPEVLEGEHGDLVITPHPGEMARLLGTTAGEVQSDRMGAAREAASRFRCVVVLKGARTLVADPSDAVFINPTGNVGMATGGTGDVLAGAIGGLLAQGLSPLEAGVCGAFVHGRAGDLAASELGMAGMIAGDVLRALPAALKMFEKSE